MARRQTAKSSNAESHASGRRRNIDRGALWRWFMSGRLYRRDLLALAECSSMNYTWFVKFEWNESKSDENRSYDN
jgi:hypothetical protein